MWKVLVVSCVQCWYQVMYYRIYEWNECVGSSGIVWDDMRLYRILSTYQPSLTQPRLQPLWLQGGVCEAGNLWLVSWGLRYLSSSTPASISCQNLSPFATYNIIQPKRRKGVCKLFSRHEFKQKEQGFPTWRYPICCGNANRSHLDCRRMPQVSYRVTLHV